MDRSPPSTLISWLRAAGDPSRLRLLALCADSALSVSELARALRQSEPRTSRHLKILCEAALVERLRQGQRVHYRAATGAQATSFVRGLLGLLDRSDPTLVQDRAGAQQQAAAEGGQSRLGRALASLILSGRRDTQADSVLLVGATRPSCSRLRRAWARRARSWQRHAARGPGPAPTRSGRDFPVASSRPRPRRYWALRTWYAAAAAFSVVIIDQPASGASSLAQALQHAQRALVPEGQLWLLERYDSLDSAGERVVEHPLSRLRRLLRDAGLTCERISPVEADGEHVLAALAGPARCGSRSTWRTAHEPVSRAHPASRSSSSRLPMRRWSHAVGIDQRPGAARAALRLGDLRRRRLHARAHARGRHAHPARDPRLRARRT